DDAPNKTSASKNSTTDSSATAAASTPEPSSVTPGATNSNKVAAVDNSSAPNRNNGSASNGPVFKNGAPPDSYPTVNKKDPWESMNRSVFSFNEKIDENVLKPVARGYKWIMPDPLETAVGNVFSNLNDIPVTFNNILQLKLRNALRSSGRFVVNSTVGLGGMVDVASDIGLEKQNEDFGQTLGYYGIAPGPYLVLPVLGPSSTRDAGGLPIDFATDPIAVGSFFVAPFIGPVVGSTRFADTRARLLDNDKTLNEASLDKYEFMREAYLQRRRNLVHDGNPPPHKDDEDLE
ncbi:MAG TPA: VacJ family lipoprotein, partial [Nitrosospira sp.]|nr:VacJ family lipoprotein [Nitrosospira sp.]